MEIIEKLREYLRRVAQIAGVADDMLLPIAEVVVDSVNALKRLGASDEELGALYSERLAVLDAELEKALTTPVVRHPDDK